MYQNLPFQSIIHAEKHPALNQISICIHVHMYISNIYKSTYLDFVYQKCAFQRLIHAEVHPVVDRTAEQNHPSICKQILQCL